MLSKHEAAWSSRKLSLSSYINQYPKFAHIKTQSCNPFFPTFSGRSLDSPSPSLRIIIAMLPDHKPIPDPPYPPLSPVAGSDDPDAMLSGSEFLTAEETIRRRHLRITQLSRIYRDQYWALMADLRSKYRDYLWYYGSSPFVGGEKSQVYGFGLWNGEIDLCRGKVDGSGISRCAHSSCRQKAMPMTRFCHSHILDDSKQVLYKGCTRVATNWKLI